MNTPRRLNLLLLAMIAIAMLSFTGCGDSTPPPSTPTPPPAPKLYSEGYRGPGYIPKLSFKGESDARKTFEGELKIIGEDKPWPFSVDPAKDKVIKDLQDAQDNSTKVKLKYQQWHPNDLTQRDYMTEYRIIEVIPLK